MLVCRFAFGRREWAWLVAPILAIGFAIVVERAAAYDVGYDSACNEVDIMETFVDYPRAHVSRFASLYTTGRLKYSIAYPGDPTALVLPLNTGRAIRGEDVQQSVFQATPTPTLSNFQVQPRSLAMFRAEQLVNTPGSITLTVENGVRKVVNNSSMLLRDAVLIDIGSKTSKLTKLGRIETKGVIEVGNEPITGDYVRPKIDNLKKNQVDPGTFMELVVRSSLAARPEDKGEVRLVAWVDTYQDGQTINPPVDVHQGFTVVVAHLKLGQTPDPSAVEYNSLAAGPELPTSRMLNTVPPPVYQRLMMPVQPTMPLPPGINNGRAPAGAIPVPAPPKVPVEPPPSIELPVPPPDPGAGAAAPCGLNANNDMEAFGS